MNKYTIVYLLDWNARKVLLCKKIKTDFRGQYNGVGGEHLSGESDYQCAIRETKEETGVDIAGRLYRLGVLTLPRDCKHHDSEGAYLAFFCANVLQKEVHQPAGEREELKWFDLDYVLDTTCRSEEFAGNGDLQFFVNLAKMHYEATGW